MRTLKTYELRGLNEEIQGAVAALQAQIETESYELQVVREVARELGPAIAFDLDRFAEALSGRYSISLDDASQLVDDFDWWQRARKALGFMKQKQGIVNGEIARRRAYDAEQAVFDIKGKIAKAAHCLLAVKACESESDQRLFEEGRALLVEVDRYLSKIGA